MSGHVVFRDMRPEDVKVITFGEPGSLIDRVDRPDVVARVALYENRIVGYAVSWLAVVHRTRRFIDVEVHPDSGPSDRYAAGASDPAEGRSTIGDQGHCWF